MVNKKGCLLLVLELAVAPCAWAQGTLPLPMFPDSMHINWGTPPLPGFPKSMYIPGVPRPTNALWFQVSSKQASAAQLRADPYYWPLRNLEQPVESELRGAIENKCAAEGVNANTVDNIVLCYGKYRTVLYGTDNYGQAYAACDTWVSFWNSGGYTNVDIRKQSCLREVTFALNKFSLLRVPTNSCAAACKN
jgi:hypothetical protein